MNRRSFLAALSLAPVAAKIHPWRSDHLDPARTTFTTPPKGHKFPMRFITPDGRIFIFDGIHPGRRIG